MGNDMNAVKLINKNGDVVVIDPEEKKLETAIKELLQE